METSDIKLEVTDGKTINDKPYAGTQNGAATSATTSKLGATTSFTTSSWLSANTTMVAVVGGVVGGCLLIALIVTLAVVLSSGDNFPDSFNYTEVLHKSLLFYEAQRSGELPPDNRIPYRGDSALNDSGRKGEDLTGGYYDAGDHMKAVLPMAWSMGVLSWGFLEFRDSYEDANEVRYMLDCIKWGTDYILKSHTGDYEFYTQVADKDLDHGYWGRPEDMTMDRPAYPVNTTVPGSDAAGDSAAALAAASIIFREHDPEYSERLLKHAKELFEFADNYRGYYRDCLPEGKGIYISNSNYHDEIGWASIWLYRATGENWYLNRTEEIYHNMTGGRPYAFGWSIVDSGVHMLLYNETGDTEYSKRVTRFVDEWLPGGRVKQTDKGLTFRDGWGSLRYATATAFIALVAAENNLNVEEYREYAKSQVHYALGRTGRSFVCGFGVNPPVQPHHRSSSCPYPPDPCTYGLTFNVNQPNAHVLYGAMVGGPDENDDYVDNRKDYYKNEVTLDYNAGFQSAVAGLRHIELKGQLP
ncbi:endoglucanase F-like isoform X2 [Ptychodera flava]|uniref:endoglucanase F-like isoform X2 n=1 Tax=Ptychodera flava TaxID=63121 RepID=UPI00396A9114